jgi:hypothetical protein
MRLNRKAVVFAAILAGGVATSAFAQIPNPLDWVFPHHQGQPASAPASSQENDSHCSMDQHENDYINECGELIRGWQGTPVGGG